MTRRFRLAFVGSGSGGRGGITVLGPHAGRTGCAPRSGGGPTSWRRPPWRATAAGTAAPTRGLRERLRPVEQTVLESSVGARRNRRLSACGLEELDRVAGGVFEQDLLAARPADDVVAERHAGRAQPLDLRGDVVDDEVDAVPTARLRRLAIRHRPSGGALRATEEQAQVAAHDVGERRCSAGTQLEPEVGRVEVDCLVDVVDHVADVHELIAHLRTPSAWSP